MNTITEIALKIFGSNVFRYFLIAGIPFVFFYLLFPTKMSRRKIQQRLAGKKDFIREILHSMQTSVVFTGITCLLFFTPIKHYTQLRDDLNAFPLWYIVLSLVISLVIHDTYFYWMHRLLHHEKLFRYTHLVHHKSTNPSPWTSYSFHILEAVAEGLVLILIAMIIPMNVTTIVLFTVTAFIINVYGHLGYELMPKNFRSSWLFQVVNSSLYHNLHHSKFKGNYGLYFRVWDRMMGTENPDYVKEYDKLQAKRFGTPPVEVSPIVIR